ncbi:ImpA family type VI secretion system protein [Rosenbergiella metrosideri]|uniref:type VI secretion system protein TssA n=1 Tax=Rosenbergiella metrosideri TaxID=2921185 RepID=UPI001F4FDA5F|nr:type VI secretion system ImpA family N-terminal domain-containing protein [Rosenbergiella metrosideri]
MLPNLTYPCPEWYLPLLEPTNDSPPCGESLEYDPAFIMLQGQLQPRLGAEYGDFVEAIDPIKWAEVEREARTLLLKSKDVRLVIILMRCRLHSIGLSAVNEGLNALLHLITQWPQDFHPLPMDEGEYVPILRANAFAELSSHEGYLADLRLEPLPKAKGLQLTLRDVERALSGPADEDTQSEVTVKAILETLHNDPSIVSLQHAAEKLRELKAILDHSLGDDAPDFSALTSLLVFFSSNTAIAPLENDQPVQSETPLPTCHVEPPNASSPPPNPLPSADPRPLSVEKTVITTPSAAVISDRREALRRLEQLRSWFSEKEPSSPAILLLSLTAHTVGKSFIELLDILPAELIANLKSLQDIAECD